MVREGGKSEKQKAPMVPGEVFLMFFFRKRKYVRGGRVRTGNKGEICARKTKRVFPIRIAAECNLESFAHTASSFCTPFQHIIMELTVYASF
jgi:hypothetical protein